MLKKLLTIARGGPRPVLSHGRVNTILCGVKEVTYHSEREAQARPQSWSGEHNIVWCKRSYLP